MKKILKTLGIIIGLPALYLLISVVINNIYLFAKLAINKLPLTNESIKSMNPEIINNTYIISSITNLVFLGLLFIIFLTAKRGLIKRCNFNKISGKDITSSVLLGVGLSTIGMFIVGLLIKIFPSYNQVANALGASSNSIFKLLLLIVFIPIFEEIFFRGIIFGYLKENYNIVVSVIVQALIFAAMHLNIIQGVYTFILGIALAFVYIHSKSIISSMIMHITYNLFGVFIIPKTLQINPNFSLILLLVAIVCLIIATLQILSKYSHKLYES